MFRLNPDLLTALKSEPRLFEPVYWVIGGACSGKSTVCREIAARCAVTLYDMDEHSFGSYMGRYTWTRHPASKSWFSAENPLEWALSLSWPEFDSLYRAVNGEMLDLFAEDVRNGVGNGGPLLVDGGVTHPSLLAQVMSPARVLCIGVDHQTAADCWNHDPARRPMKEMVEELANPNASWSKFLAFDRHISDTIVRESVESGIRICHRDAALTSGELANSILDHFGL